LNLVAQAHIFRDFRTGAVDIPMANTGYTIYNAISNSGGWQFTDSKSGAAVLSNGFASGAGAITPNTGTPNLITVTIPQQ
jgi:hypothetical protein